MKENENMFVSFTSGTIEEGLEKLNAKVTNGFIINNLNVIYDGRLYQFIFSCKKKFDRDNDKRQKFDRSQNGEKKEFINGRQNGKKTAIEKVLSDVISDGGLDNTEFNNRYKEKNKRKNNYENKKRYK